MMNIIAQCFSNRTSEEKYELSPRIGILFWGKGWCVFSYMKDSRTVVGGGMALLFSLFGDYDFKRQVPSGQGMDCHGLLMSPLG